MDIQIIALWIGLAITLVLGLVNFLWGPAILARREKIAVVRPEVYPEFLPPGTSMRRIGGESIALIHAQLSIEARCELVLIRGEKESEVRDVEVILHEVTCNQLRRYFNLPRRNRLYLDPIEITDISTEVVLTRAILQPKKPMRFEDKVYLDCTDEFKKEYEKMGRGSYPEFIQPLLDELETKYQICWTRYDGKELCRHFPDKWWRNLGKRLWG